MKAQFIVMLNKWCTKYIDMFGSQCQALKPLWQGMHDDIFQKFIWQVSECHCDGFGKENAMSAKSRLVVCV